jgi:hypothetical protein
MTEQGKKYLSDILRSIDLIEQFTATVILSLIYHRLIALQYLKYMFKQTMIICLK